MVQLIVLSWRKNTVARTLNGRLKMKFTLN
ncbi:hypothetical protein vBEcoMWL3_gp208c [Escherichia phage vB_EcoM_WL-3]|nr:hypothetical protein vBEcoMWL3_gp208c [Escherichia phage vB_EcoM_WL-3]